MHITFLGDLLLRLLLHGLLLYLRRCRLHAKDRQATRILRKLKQYQYAGLRLRYGHLLVDERVEHPNTQLAQVLRHAQMDRQNQTPPRAPALPYFHVFLHVTDLARTVDGLHDLLPGCGANRHHLQEPLQHDTRARDH